MKFHPLSEIFPLMQGREFDELVADIKANGLREAIWVVATEQPDPSGYNCGLPEDPRCDFEDHGDGIWHCNHCGQSPAKIEYQILDGRNRWRACEVAGIEPQIQEYVGDDLVSFVVSVNLHRRHLDESQRAVVAARIATLPKGSNQHSPIGESTTQTSAAEMLNVGKRTVERAREVLVHGSPELVSAVESGRVSVSAAADVSELPKEQQREIVARGEKEILEAAKDIRSKKAEESRAKRDEEKRKALEITPPSGQYRCIVIDPPWAMEKIDRDVRPNQVGFDYPTMSVEELADFAIPAAEECHLYCWTTQKFLPEALKLMHSWGFTYVFTMVWHKNGGPQPFGLPQYNCEFVVFGRKGGLEFLDTKQFFTCFNAPRREHSRKPDKFYDVVRRVSPGPRIDIFSREQRDGFDQFGNEVKKFA